MEQRDNGDIGRKPFIQGIAVVSADGMIARFATDNPKDWASAEDAQYLSAQLALGGVYLMGRITHELFPDSKHRPRVVFSRQITHPTPLDQHTLLVNPNTITRKELVELCVAHGASTRIVVMGGAQVYRYVLEKVGYDRFDLSVERNITFGSGLPLFGTPAYPSIAAVLRQHALSEVSTILLTTAGLELNIFTVQTGAV